jgi:hypothetical protein
VHEARNTRRAHPNSGPPRPCGAPPRPSVHVCKMRQISEASFEGIAAQGSGKTYTCLLCFPRARLRGRVTGADSNLYEHMRAHHGLDIGTVTGLYPATRKRFDELARAIQAAYAARAERAWDALRAHDVRTSFAFVVPCDAYPFRTLEAQRTPCQIKLSEAQAANKDNISTWSSLLQYCAEESI